MYTFRQLRRHPYGHAEEQIHTRQCHSSYKLRRLNCDELEVCVSVLLRAHADDDVTVEMCACVICSVFFFLHTTALSIMVFVYPHLCYKQIINTSVKRIKRSR